MADFMRDLIVWTTHLVCVLLLILVCVCLLWAISHVWINVARV